MRFGLSLSSDLHGDWFFTLLASHWASWLNALGGEWRNDLQIGHSDRIATEFYQPLIPAQRLFVAPHAESVREPFDIYVDGVRVASYRRDVIGGGIDLGVPLGTAGEVRLGVSCERLKLHTDTSIIPGELLPTVDMGGVNARPRIDTLDNRYFPRAGYDAGVQVYAARGVLGADDTYTKVSAASSYHVSALGLLDGAYVGGSLETGCLAALVIAGQHPTTRVGASLYFAFDTPLGPVYLAYGHGEGSNQAVYLFLGLPP